MSNKNECQSEYRIGEVVHFDRFNSGKTELATIVGWYKRRCAEVITLLGGDVFIAPYETLTHVDFGVGAEHD